LLSGEHEEIALELEQAATRAQRQGAIAVAVSAMRRAAVLSEPTSRSRRLLWAARLAVELGRRDVVVPLLHELNQLDLSDLEQARVTWIEETTLTRPLGEIGRFTSTFPPVLGLPSSNDCMAPGIVEPRTGVLRSTHGQDTQGRPLAASAFTSGRGPVLGRPD
jgi:hypothetical protein